MQDQKSCLTHSPVVASRRGAELTLDGLCQPDTLLHVLVLYELKHDVALCRIGVEARIALFVIAFNEDDRVLFLGNGKVFLCPVQSQGVGLRSPCDFPFGQ